MVSQNQHEKHCEEILRGEGNRKHCGGIAYVWGAVTSPQLTVPVFVISGNSSGN